MIAVWLARVIMWRSMQFADTFSVPSSNHLIETFPEKLAFLILVGARIFSLTFYGVNGHVWVEEMLAALPGGLYGFLIVVNLAVFFLAFFLDFFELSFIVVPLLAPVAQKLGVDLIWFGVLLAVNMQTSFMHPPFGFALFYLRSVAPEKAYVDRVTGKVMEPVTTMQIYKGAIPFVLMQLVMVGVLIMSPGLVTGSLDEKVTVDMDAVGAPMRQSLGEGAAGGAPQSGASAAGDSWGNDSGYGAGNPSAEPEPTAPAATPAAPAGNAAEPAAGGGYGNDDPTKALNDALKQGSK